MNRSSKDIKMKKALWTIVSKLGSSYTSVLMSKLRTSLKLGISVMVDLNRWQLRLRGLRMIFSFERTSEVGMEQIRRAREMLREMACLRMDEEGGTFMEGLEGKQQVA